MPTSLSRREFNQFSARVFIPAAVVAGSAWLRHTFKTNETISAVLEGPDTGEIISRVPPSLYKTEIPCENPDFRSVEKLVIEGFDLYNSWRQQDTTLPELRYDRPENYLSLFRGALIGISNLPEILDRNAPEWDKLVDRTKRLMIAEIDTPGSAFISFSYDDINGPETLLTLDPGSGFGDAAVIALKAKYGETFNPYSNAGKDPQAILDAYAGRYTEITKAITRYAENGPVSTSVLFAVNLYLNRGQIVPGLWDTAIYLKILARTNPRTLKKGYFENNKRLLTRLFTDDFSRGLPLTWVAENVPHDLIAADSKKYGIPAIYFSDFNIFVRMGQPYHAWINIAGAACMHPRYVAWMNNSYYTLGYNLRDGAHIAQWNGIFKTDSDLRTSQAAGGIRKLIRKYNS